MKRLITAAIGIPLVLAAIFTLPSWGFGLVILAVFLWAAKEYIGILELSAPGAPLVVLYPLVALGAAGLGWLPRESWPSGDARLFVTVAGLSIGLAVVVLLARTPIESGFAATTGLAFATAYFVLPVACFYRLHVYDRWLVILLLAIVWCGDSAAYYVGKSLGRRKLAPRVSPNKTWEGAVAGMVASLAAAALWGLWRLGEPSSRLLLLAAVTAIAAQLGDLFESLVKRGAGVKDSGAVLPGHGGFWDRLDALFFAAPALYLGLRLLGPRLTLP